jgi:hypothetical protein
VIDRPVPATAVPRRTTARLAAAVAGALVIVTLAQGQSQRRGSWSDRTPALWSKFYLIKTDLPLGEARSYGRHLDRMYEQYARRLADLPPRTKEELNVYIFAKRDDYLETMLSRFRIDARGTGGMFFVKSTGSGLAFWTGSLPVRRIHHVIQHEGFHQFAYSRFGADLPTWVNEGLAEFFGEAVLIGDRLVLGQSTPRVIETVRSAIASDRSIPFDHMLGMSLDQWNTRLGGEQAALLYHQAWSMVHFLVYGEGARFQPPFERYLRLVNSGLASEPAFVRVFGADVGAFERRWKAYAREARPAAFVTALERIEFLAEGAMAATRSDHESDEDPVTTLAELRAKLRAIQFTHTLDHHGRSDLVTAADDANFEIPVIDENGPAPRFVVEPTKHRRLTRRQRFLLERHPTPPAIRTENLRPRDLAVRWIHDQETGEVRYRIEVH